MINLDKITGFSFRRFGMDIFNTILGIAAFILAMGGVLYVFSRPKLTAEFHSSNPEEEDNRLYMVLRNEAITNKWLHRLGIARAKANIRGRYIIKNTEGQYLDQGTQWIRLNHGAHEVVISLEEHQWATLPCVHHISHAAIFCAGHEEHYDSRRFKPGRYVYHVELETTGGGKHITREFTFTLENGLEWGAFVKPGRNRA